MRPKSALKLNFNLLVAQAMLLGLVIGAGASLRAALTAPVVAKAPMPSGSPAPANPPAPNLNPPARLVADSSHAVTRLPSYPHPQVKYQALAAPSVAGLTQNQTFMQRIGTTDGWSKINNSNPAPLIAVIDSGFSLNHEALIDRWQAAPTSVDWLGYDFVSDDADPSAGTTSPSGAGVFHGTMTAGLASVINPAARLLPLQALDDDGNGFTDQVAAAVRYAADNGARVINLSLGSTEPDPFLREQIDYAIAKGVAVVASAGNSSCNCLSYPAAYPEVMAVGATTSSDSVASFSSYGANLDVLAPGTAGDVCSAYYTAANPTNRYSCGFSGTSFSAPIAAGLIALLLQQNSSLGVADVITVLESTATKIPSMNGQAHTLTAGYGRVNVAAAMAAVSIGRPYGQLLSRQSLSLTGVSLASGPLMNTTCSGISGASCQIQLIGPSGGMIDLGAKTLDAYGGAEFNWNASSLGLAPGNWQIKATQSAYGQAVSTTTQNLLVSP